MAARMTGRHYPLVTSYECDTVGCRRRPTFPTERVAGVRTIKTPVRGASEPSRSYTCCPRDISILSHSRGDSFGAKHPSRGCKFLRSGLPELLISFRGTHACLSPSPGRPKPLLQSSGTVSGT